MGINSIRCEGYEKACETGFSEGTRSASDFNIDSGDVWLIVGLGMMGLAVSAHYENSRLIEQARIDKNNSAPISVGVVTGEYNGRFGSSYTVHLVDAVPEDARKADVILQRSLDNLSNGTRPSNVCSFEREVGWPEPPHSYLVSCIERTDKDGIEIGDYVGVYRVVFESEK